MSKKEKKQKAVLDNRAAKRAGLMALIIVAALALIYVVFGFYFNSHFYIRSTVNGVGASFKSPAGAFRAITNDASDFTITFIKEDGSDGAVVTSDQVGLSVDYDVDDVAALLEGQNGFAWGYYLIKGKAYATSQGNTFDEALVDEVVASLDLNYIAELTDSQSATITYNSGSGTFEIREEVYGNNIDKNQVKRALIDAIENLHSQIMLSDGACYEKPAVLASDAKIIAACDTLNTYMNRNIHYDLGEGITEEILADTKAGWFSWDDDFNVSFNRDAIGEFVNSMGEKYNTYGKAKDFTTTSGQQITVGAGSFGWRIAYDGEIDQIITDLQGEEDVTRDFVYLYYGTSHGDHDYGNSYVEVNLSEQHVYVYKDGQLVVSTDCVTGNVLNGHGTHTGCYPIAYKQKDATLRGDNYESHVNYWMPFNMGEGLHDATWRSKFGGTIYQGNGSHGCVNLPKAKAKEIYETVEAGWPVFVFYTGDTEAQINKLLNPQNDVIDYINAIGEVTLDKEYAITYARLHYDALNDEQKTQVSNYDVLVNAENTLAALKAAAGLTTDTSGATTDATGATDATGTVTQ